MFWVFDNVIRVVREIFLSFSIIKYVFLLEFYGFA